MVVNFILSCLTNLRIKVGSLNNILYRYLEYAQGKYSISDENDNTLFNWQCKFFSKIMMYLFPLSIVLYLPSQFMSFLDELYLLAIYNSIAIATVFVIHFSSQLSIKIRIYLFLSVLYMLGWVLLATMGWISPGLVYLIFISAFAVILHSKKVGYYALTLNLLTFITLFIISELSLVGREFFSNIDTVALIVMSLNYLIINYLLIVAIGSLIDAFQNKINKEIQLVEELREESENHIKARIKAEDNEKLKTAFLQNISHEIRTPVNGIVGITNLILESTSQDSEINEYGKLIVKSSKRLMETISNIVDISKIHAGETKIKIVEFPINKLIYDLMDYFLPVAQSKDVKFNYNTILKDQASYIKSDPKVIYRIWSNIIDNAIKFTKNGNVDFGYSINENDALFWVKDTGIGISQEHLEKIFERFYQSDLSISRGYEGAGLGLSISMELVKLLKGDIWVKSEINKGAEFYFSIPIS